MKISVQKFFMLTFGLCREATCTRSQGQGEYCEAQHTVHFLSVTQSALFNKNTNLKVKTAQSFTILREQNFRANSLL